MRVIIIFIGLVLIYSCQINCLDEQVRQTKRVANYDYYLFSSSLKEFLLDSSYINSYTPFGIKTFFKKKKYCDINLETWPKHIDMSLSNTPSFTYTFYNCDKIYPKLPKLNKWDLLNLINF